MDAELVVIGPIAVFFIAVSSQAEVGERCCEYQLLFLITGEEERTGDDRGDAECNEELHDDGRNRVLGKGCFQELICILIDHQLEDWAVGNVSSSNVGHVVGLDITVSCAGIHYMLVGYVSRTFIPRSLEPG